LHNSNACLVHARAIIRIVTYSGIYLLQIIASDLKPLAQPTIMGAARYRNQITLPVAQSNPARYLGRTIRDRDCMNDLAPRITSRIVRPGLTESALRSPNLISAQVTTSSPVSQKPAIERQGTEPGPPRAIPGLVVGIHHSVTFDIIIPAEVPCRDYR
jgi:hypothetical protein